MEYLSEAQNDAMGELHNGVVELIDKTKLSPPEIIIILRMVANNIERLFEVSVRGK